MKIEHFTTFGEYLKEKNVQEFIGYLKGRYSSIKEVKNCKRFKELPEDEQESIIDELKADGWK